MMKSLGRRIACAATVAVAVLVGAVAPASADEPDAVIDLPAGIACDFGLRVEVRGGPQVVKEFRDDDGNVVRMITAGRGSALTFINLDTDDSLSLRANGSVSDVVFHADGSSTWTTKGHNVLILFPTDVPAGPSTKLYIGRLVFTVDANGVFTVQSVNGRTIDLCEALSP